MDVIPLGYDISILDRMSPAVKEMAMRQIAEQDAKKAKQELDKWVSELQTEAAEKEPQKKKDGTKRKYHNQPTDRTLPNGATIKFDSKHEASHYDELLMMQKAGAIRKLRLQQSYQLQPAFTDGATGERFKAITYLADFVYEKLDYDSGKWNTVIEDCKGGAKGGTRTKEYTIKRKLMAANGLIITEVT